MPKRSSKPRQITDPSLLAFRVLKAITESKTGDAPPTKDPLAVELGRRGGLKGGKARAKSLSARKRSEIAKAAAKARWKRR
jgi:hypothetical protein